MEAKDNTGKRIHALSGLGTQRGKIGFMPLIITRNDQDIICTNSLLSIFIPSIYSIYLSTKESYSQCSQIQPSQCSLLSSQ